MDIVIIVYKVDGLKVQVQHWNMLCLEHEEFTKKQIHLYTEHCENKKRFVFFKDKETT